MVVYEYHPVTYEYLGEVTLQADLFLPGSYIELPYTTTLQPPIITEERKKAVFDTNTNSWSIVNDYRGLQYITPQGFVYTISSLDFQLPEGCGLVLDNSIPLQKPYSYNIPKIENGIFIGWDISLPQLKLYKLAYITEQFNSCETKGFFSQTIQKKINSSREDKDNMQSLLTYMEQKNLAYTAFRLYDNSIIYITQEQLRNMLTELLEYGVWIYQHKWELQARVNSCNTVEEVLEVVW